MQYYKILLDKSEIKIINDVESFDSLAHSIIHYRGLTSGIGLLPNPPVNTEPSLSPHQSHLMTVLCVM